MLNQQQQEQLMRGKKLVDERQFHQAVTELTSLNEQTADFAVNQVLTAALKGDGQVQLAIKIAEDHVEDYLETEKTAKQLVDLELAGQQFITARRQAAFVPQWKAALNRQIEVAEQQAEVTMKATLTNRLKSFYHLGDGSFRQQRQRLLEAEQLPLEMYLTGALFLLRDPFTKPLIKSSILETLQPLKIDRQVTILWLDDQEYQLNLAQLVPLTKIPQVATMLTALEKKYGQSDPATLAAMTDQLNLQMIFLYPLIDHAVVDTEAWLTALTSAGRLVSPDEKVVAAQKWQRKIQHFVDQMR